MNLEHRTREAYAELVSLTRSAVDRALDGVKRPAVLASGGIDSSIVACLAPHVARIHGFYENAPPGFDERPYSRLLGGDRVEVAIKPTDFVRNYDDMRAAIRPPFMGPGTFGQYMVARRARELGFDTLLSGEGGDELFGGYARLIMVARGTMPPGYEDYQPPEDYPADVHNALLYDWERLPHLLAVDEQVCAANGIVSLAPLLDQPIVDWTFLRQPEDRVAKKIPRVAFRGIVPNLILNRDDKKGFPSPLVLWAQDDPVRSFVAERIGYVPDPKLPWDRKWWTELLERT